MAQSEKQPASGSAAPSPAAPTASEQAPQAPPAPAPQRTVHSDGLNPPAVDTAVPGPSGTEDIHGNRQGVTHRAFPVDQAPQPSERMFESVEDDRVLKPRPGPPERDPQER